MSSLHYCCGAYPKFRKGQVVEISESGDLHGLLELRESSFGVVVKFEGGILTVLRDGMSKATDYHPCFWELSTKGRREAVLLEEAIFYKNYGI